jgi:hypothetical protein
MPDKTPLPEISVRNLGELLSDYLRPTCHCYRLRLRSNPPFKQSLATFFSYLQKAQEASSINHARNDNVR